MNKKLTLPMMASGLAFVISGCASKPQPHPVEWESMAVSATQIDGHSVLLTEPEPEPEYPGDTVTDNSNLWERIRQGFAMDLSQDNPRIEVQRNWYASNQAYLDRVATRASRYLHHIVEEAERRNLPMELALLPIVESAFDPFAYSHGSASGPWQFISSTGRIFGLRQDWWYDGRRDILESTRAAYDYLERLNNRFDGDWLLALAAYNAGSGNVSRAINRNKAAGKSTDYWSLPLPRETRAYAPKLLAIAQIVQDPGKYGVELQPIANQPYFDVVDLQGQIDLAQAAHLADMSEEELHLLNPGFNRWATSPEGPHRLLVPVAHAAPFREKLASIDLNDLVQWDKYNIRNGDSLIKIAQRFNTTSDVLKSANRLRSNRIIAGQTLLIPRASKPLNEYAMTEEARLKARQSRPVPGRQRIDHIVQPGDTLWELAQRHQVGVRELAKWNRMAPRDALKVGQTLAIWTTQAATVRQTPTTMIRKVNYPVRRGDSLYRIADKFNVSINDIKQWNTLDTRRYLQPGQRLTLYVDIRDAN